MLDHVRNRKITEDEFLKKDEVHESNELIPSSVRISQPNSFSTALDYSKHLLHYFPSTNDGSDA
jgi:hypothetical protein